MKTKLVRPIFIDVNDIKISIVMKGVMPNLCRLTTDVIDDEEWLRFGKPQQLILISLDPDETIEENDSWIGHKIGEIEEESKLIIVTPENRQSIFHNIVKSKFGKVIATQDQLSSELINQLVAEYNNGGMQDFEIEMEVITEPTQDGNWDKYTQYKPKLTNGFVTVVEKLQIPTETNSDAFDRGFIAGENSVRERLEAVLYSEEEVIRLFENWMNTKIQEELMRLSGELDELGSISFEDWFNENKKK